MEERQDLLVARIGEYWSDWYEDEARRYKPEIERLRDNHPAHQLFARYIKEWAEKQWPDHSQASAWLLFALSREEPFDQWAGLENHRKPDGLKGVYGLYLHRREGADKEDVVITRSVLVPNPRPKSSQPVYYADRLLLLDEQAKKTPQNAIDAVTKLLTGWAFWWHFFLWALLGEKPAGRQAARTRRRFGWLLCLALFGFLTLADPWEYFEDDTLLVSVALVFAGLSLLLIFNHLAPVLREWFYINRHRRRWVDHLRHSCACFIIGDGNQLGVIGPSFGVSLFFSILLALDRDLRTQSYLAHRFMDQFKSLSSSSAFTGEIQSDGRIRPIARLKDKIEAVQACGFLDRFIVPEQIDVPNGSQHFRSDGAYVPGAVYAAGSVEIKPYSKVMPLIKAIGNFASLSRLSRGGAILMNIIRASLLVIALFAIWHVRQLMLPLPDPILSGSLDTDAILRLKIKTGAPTFFEADFTSDYWANQPAKQFDPDPKNISSGLIEFQLERRGVRKGNDVMNGIVEVKRLRQFLWIELPPTAPITKVPLNRLLRR